MRRAWLITFAVAYMAAFLSLALRPWLQQWLYGR